MINSLRGKIKLKEKDYITLDVQGIGFKIFCLKRDLLQFNPGEDLELFIYFYRTQNVLALYGFRSLEEKVFFELLVDLPGIGPKASLAITSLGPIEKIKTAIEKGDEKFFSGLSSVGHKKIQKVILELSGKLQIANRKSQIISLNTEAVEALINLGVSRPKAKEIVGQVAKKVEGTENIVREALKQLGK